MCYYTIEVMTMSRGRIAVLIPAVYDTLDKQFLTLILGILETTHTPATSPDERNDLTPDLLPVFLIPLEVLREHFLLITDTKGDYRHICQHDGKGKQGAQHQGHRKEQEYRRRIHRMAYYTIQTGINDLLVFLHLHGSGEPDIFPQHLGVEGIAHEEQHRGHDDHGEGDFGPAEAEVQPREDEAAEEDEAHDGHHALLGALLFLHVQPLGEEVAGAGEHDDAQEEHGDKEEAEEEEELVRALPEID